MSYVRNWLHCVWGTKAKTPLLTSSNKAEILNHILENARSKGIFIKAINGDKDHIHFLLSLNPDQSLSKVIQLLKGESSFWINKQKLSRTKFEWANEYFAVSLSESQIEKVRTYILNQEEHHKKKSWDEEYDEFMKNYNFEKI